MSGADTQPYVKVGVLGGAKDARQGGEIGNVELAMIHEFGSPKAGIPERSFIRSTFEMGKAGYVADFRRLLVAVVEGKMTVPRALGLMGLKISSDIKKRVTSGTGIPPPNAPSTIAAKGSSRPLIDTGRLVNSVSHEVVMTDKGGGTG